MKAHSDIKRIMFSARQIQERVKQVADEITQDYKGKRPMIAGVLKGAWILFAWQATAADVLILPAK